MNLIEDKVLKFMSGKPVIFKDICLISSPFLKDIAAEGLSKFYEYIGLILIQKPTAGEEELQKLLSPLSNFEYLIMLSQLDAEQNLAIKSAFRFFTNEKVTFITNPPSIVFGDPAEKRILTADSFLEFQDIISLACALFDTKEDIIEFLDSDTPKVRELKKQMLEGRKKRKEAKSKEAKKRGESTLELSDLIGSLTIGSNSYNLINAWDLTYYAFQDQLRRMNWLEEFDINTRASLAGAKIDKNKLSHWIKTMSFN